MGNSNNLPKFDDFPVKTNLWYNNQTATRVIIVKKSQLESTYLQLNLYYKFIINNIKDYHRRNIYVSTLYLLKSMNLKSHVRFINGKMRTKYGYVGYA